MNKQLRFVITYMLLGLAALFIHTHENIEICLLYTSDAADECVNV